MDPVTAGAAPDEPEIAQPGRWSRVLPAGVRRRPVTAGIGAGVLAIAVIVQAVVFRSASPLSQARKIYRGAAATLRCHCPGVTVSAKPVAGLGDQATEAFVTAGPDADFTKAPNASEPGTSLLVLSSNAVISLYLDTTVAATGGSRASPPSSDQLAGMIAMARDGLAALADPASAPILRGPRYAQPRDPCQLIRASTRSRYAAGVTGQSDDRSCTWFPADGDLFLDVSTYDSLDEAESSYRFNLQFAHQDPGVKFRGSRPVRNVGAQATAIFLTSPTGNPGVELEVWSGNAVVQMTFDGDPVLAPAPSQATMLAAGIAMARDVLAGLRRT